MLNQTRVLVGFSGGVDSTASVILLKKAGYEVVGLCFNVLNDEFPDSIQNCADKLGIKLIKKCVAKEFAEKVIEPFKEAYELGKTPNPCIFCNPQIKFKTLIDIANEEDCGFISTGHYAGIEQKDGSFYIKKAANKAKDQSYMLYRLPQDILSRLIFPLNRVKNKEDVRMLLRAENSPNSEDKDSQDICFIPDGDYKSYLLSAGALNRSGNYIDSSGNIIATHQGVLSYTVGQRKGLGITFGKPMYVIGFKGNDVILGTNDELFKNIVIVNQLFWTAKVPKDGERLSCKLRYTAKEANCTLRWYSNDEIMLEFDEAQRGPTPGQSAVLYDNELVIGGGFIVK